VGLGFAPEMITIRFAGWISGRIVSLQPDTDIQNAFIDVSRILTFGKRFSLHNHSFVIFISIFSAFSFITPSLSMV